MSGISFSFIHSYFESLLSVKQVRQTPMIKWPWESECVCASIYTFHVSFTFDHNNSTSDLTGSGLPSRNYVVKSRRRWTPKPAKAGRSGKLSRCVQDVFSIVNLPIPVNDAISPANNTRKIYNLIICIINLSDRIFSLM